MAAITKMTRKCGYKWRVTIDMPDVKKFSKSFAGKRQPNSIQTMNPRL